MTADGTSDDRSKVENENRLRSEGAARERAILWEIAQERGSADLVDALFAGVRADRAASSVAAPAKTDEAREIDRLKALLEGRDRFIVEKGLWMDFVGTLPQRTSRHVGAVPALPESFPVDAEETEALAGMDAYYADIAKEHSHLVADTRTRLLEGTISSESARKRLGLRLWTALFASLDDKTAKRVLDQQDQGDRA